MVLDLQNSKTGSDLRPEPPADLKDLLPNATCCSFRVLHHLSPMSHKNVLNLPSFYSGLFDGVEKLRFVCV